MASPARSVVLHAAFLVSGVTALIYQVVWSRYLTLFVGGTSVAHTIVLATFMGGLAFGNAFFGRRADRANANHLRQYALLETGIGLSCLLFPLAFERLSALYLWLAAANGPGASTNHLLKLALSAAAMFVPCAFMGGTLPVLAKFVVDRMSRFGVKIGWLYFINTAGAVVGCVLGGFYLIERWGLEATMTAGALTNLAIGAAFYLWSRRDVPAAVGAEEEAPAPGSVEPTYTPRQGAVAFWCIAVAGGVSMLYELAWTRVLILSMGGTVHSFSTMLVSFIFGIALGSALIGRVLRRPRNALALFALCELGIALAILLPMSLYERLPFAFHRVGSWVAHEPENYGLYLVGQVMTSLLIMLVPTTLIGAALPLATRVYVESLDVLGRRVGSVFSVNTVGTVIGAALTGFVLLPRLGIERTLLLGATISGVLGVLLLRTWRPTGSRPSLRGLAETVRSSPAAQGAVLWPMAALLVAGVFGAAVLRAGWDPRLMQAGLFRWGSARFKTWDEFATLAVKNPYLYVRDGADGTIAVQDHDQLGRNVRVNGKVDASVTDMPTQLMVGHLPMLLHPQPRQAMIVGLGCGATAAAVLRHPGVHADVAEISPEMVEAAAFFEPWNDKVLHNPRMALHVLDARELLLLSNKRYDVIVSEPTNVWIPGVANLFTRDFYQVVKSRLEPGGVFAQWIQVYSADAPLVGSAVATLRAEFPYVSAWLVNEGDLILVAGERRPDFDAERFRQRFEALHASEGYGVAPRTPLAMFRHPLLFLSYQIGTGEGTGLTWPHGSQSVYRDLLPQLEFRAARAQFLGQHFWIRKQLDERLGPVGAEPLFLSDYLRRYPLDVRGQVALADLFGTMGAGFEHLKHALSATVVLDGAEDPSLLGRLSESSLAKLLLTRRIGEEIDRGVLRPGVCGVYLRAEHGLLREARSVFGLPPTERFEARMDRCIAGDPEAGPLRPEFAKALADAGAVEPALRRLRQLEQEGTLARLEPKQAADLLVAGSILLLGTAQKDEAVPWAERALKLDARNTAAARIVWALRGPGAVAPTPVGPAALPRS